MTDIPRLRKGPREAEAAASCRAASEIDIVGRATVSYSSEDPDPPIDNLLDGQSGSGATRWTTRAPIPSSTSSWNSTDRKRSRGSLRARRGRRSMKVPDRVGRRRCTTSWRSAGEWGSSTIRRHHLISGHPDGAPAAIKSALLSGRYDGIQVGVPRVALIRLPGC